jgi:hypothetical protein
MAEVHALVIECGRRAGDDLPPGASGARVVCYAPGVDVEDAIAAATTLLRDAGLAPVTASAHGTLAERRARGELSASERLLMDRVLRTGRVIIAELVPTYDGN